MGRNLVDRSVVSLIEDRFSRLKHFVHGSNVICRPDADACGCLDRSSLSPQITLQHRISVRDKSRFVFVTLVLMKKQISSEK